MRKNETCSFDWALCDNAEVPHARVFTTDGEGLEKDLLAIVPLNHPDCLASVDRASAIAEWFVEILNEKPRASPTERHYREIPNHRSILMREIHDRK